MWSQNKHWNQEPSSSSSERERERERERKRARERERDREGEKKGGGPKGGIPLEFLIFFCRSNWTGWVQIWVP